MRKSLLPSYLAVEKKLRQQISCGRLKVGDKLTPEPGLARQFHISRETLRKALEMLTADGFLLRIPGRGTFITDPEDKTSAEFRRRLYHLRRANHAIGVLVPSVTLSVYAGIIRGAEDCCRKHGYHLVLGNYDGQPERERSYLEMFVERRVAGVLACPGHKSSAAPYRQLLVKGRIPFVLAATSIPGLAADVVKTDNISAAREATSFLIEAGCKEIIFLCHYLKASNSAERLAGYREALMEYGRPVRKEYILEKSTPDYQERLRHLVSHRVDGFVSANESTTVDLVAVVNRFSRGKKWPKIIAFDRPSLLAPGRYTITFLHQPAREIGWEATEILLRHLRQQNKTRTIAGRTVILPVKKERFRFSAFRPGW
ncbi:MAG TPA: GntR family transcriptional regulator, partial [bacterium]|nr:GntR family transcriptional regulator [bacterium]HOL68206.1 GntR family transcriptional regulator [bacterium]HPP11509.1 GntR family transcriptional regulator [bacterium]